MVAHDLGNVYLGLTASRDGRTIFYSRVDSSTLDDFRTTAQRLERATHGPRHQGRRRRGRDRYL